MKFNSRTTATIVAEDTVFTFWHGEQIGDIIDPFDVKVVMDSDGKILYLTLLPTKKNAEWLAKYAPVVGTGRHDPLKTDCSTSV